MAGVAARASSLSQLTRVRESDSRTLAGFAALGECGEQVTGGAAFAVGIAALDINFDAQDHALDGLQNDNADGQRTNRSGHLPDLRRLMEDDREPDLVLDLYEVRLVDVDVVRFLIECETQGIRLAHCPGYVREWMLREKRPP